MPTVILSDHELGTFPAITYLSEESRRHALLPRAGAGAAQNDAMTRAVREASVDEIAATPGFTHSVAEKVLEGL